MSEQTTYEHKRALLRERYLSDAEDVAQAHAADLYTGGVDHLALKATVPHYQAVIASLQDHGIVHSVHGSTDSGSVYFRDPDDIMVEVTTAY